jgi:hypothetical protein
MYKDVLRAVVGIDIFPAISLVLFVVTFALAVVQALRMDSRAVERLAELPLDDARGEAACGLRRGSRSEVRPCDRGVSRG